MKTVQTLIIEAGKALSAGIRKASDMHPQVLEAIAGDANPENIKKRPASRWQADFAKLMNQQQHFEWPQRDTKKSGTVLVGYRTIEQSGEYAKKYEHAACYYNRFQSWLSSNDLIQPVKNQSARSSKTHVVGKDEILERFKALASLAPKDKQDVVLKHLQNAAKHFGIHGLQPK